VEVPHGALGKHRVRSSVRYLLIFLLALAMIRTDTKSILKLNYSNDVLNPKWVSEKSYSCIDQCCVGNAITGFR
jgi:hypothetical protein